MSRSDSTVGQLTVSGLCVESAVVAILGALEWSGVWPAFTSAGALMVWLDEQPGMTGTVLWLGFFVGIGALLLVLVRAASRALFGRSELK